MAYKIPFYRHDIGDSELENVRRVFENPILTTGEFTEQFEDEFSAYTSLPYVLGVTSCTGALHMALLAMDIGPGDEVITTPLTYVATATAIESAGAVPVFVDVEKSTGNIDASKIEDAITKKTRAILPVHLYGLMCDMFSIRDLASQYNLKIIEDCAHCVEGARSKVRPGQLSDAACYSFFATKNLTCGEGGAIAVRDERIFHRLKRLRLHGATKSAVDRYREGYSDWDVIEMGWKYNMSNIDAAILLPQLNRIDVKLRERHRLARNYSALFRDHQKIQLQSEIVDSVHARHLFTVWIDSDRMHTINKLRDCGIETVVNYNPIHLTSFFSKKYGYIAGDFPIAESIGSRTLSLPFYPFMPDEHVEEVASTLKKLLNLNGAKSRG